MDKSRKRPPYKSMTQSERLASFTKRNEETGCNEWVGYRTHGGEGYGLIWYGGKKIGAHRAAYLEHVGDIPDGLFVCHSCDNPACVTPAHLWLGTGRENTRDMVAKGRANPRKGSNNPAAKLTEEQVREIIAGTEDRFAVAARYGVSASTVWEIRAGKKWAWLHKLLGQSKGNVDGEVASMAA